MEWCFVRMYLRKLLTSALNSELITIIGYQVENTVSIIDIQMHVPFHCMQSPWRAPVSLFDTRRRCQESLRRLGNPEPQTTRLSAHQKEAPYTS